MSEGDAASTAQPSLSLKDLYGLMLREYRDAFPLRQNPDAVDLAWAGFRWVMDLDSYKQVRAAALAGGAVYPPGEESPDQWVPKPEDRLYGLLVDVREDAGAPRLERVP